MSPKRIPAGGDQSQTTPPVQQPAGKQPTNLTAETIKGNFLSGFHAEGKCRLTSKGKPLAYEDVEWYVGDHGVHLGTSQTNEKGVATLDAGSVSDFGDSIAGEFSGYAVKYLGNEQYLPADAKGHIVPVFSIF
ncbi:hypothetical protein ACMA1D_15495 [Streptomyces sp. 796.1]|uniref:hypothetical protein n=1 Tax=Streptomyces sp. 796.1 TaxID=3163029 RepID=UPI0039C94AD1